MASSLAKVLTELEKLSRIYSPEISKRKLMLLERLSKGKLGNKKQIYRLHEILCFLRAYPDEKALLQCVLSMLNEFGERTDVRRHGAELADTGIVGTTIHYSLYWLTAQWIVERWPQQLHIDWEWFDNDYKLVEYLHLLLPAYDAIALEELDRSPREWIDLYRSEEETDATFVVRRFAAMKATEEIKEALWNTMEIPMRLEADKNTPSRTTAFFDTGRTAYISNIGVRSEKEFQARTRQKPLSINPVSSGTGQKLIDLARSAMITRARDLHAFMNADKRDVSLIDSGDGLTFVCYGIKPEHRFVIETMYIFLALKNGVPVSYIQASNLFNSSEVNFNVFDTFRGNEATAIFAASLAMITHLFDSDTIVINTQQLGVDNAEAIKTGAWWFYHKHGFRSLDKKVLRIAKQEVEKKKCNPKHRSSLATLEKLSQANMHLFFKQPREDIIGNVPIGNVGLKASRYITQRFGSYRETATRQCTKEAMTLVGLKSFNG